MTEVRRSVQIAEIGIFAALYAVLTWFLAPISYMAIQFRMSEVLKSVVIKRRHIILAFVFGVALSNAFSPYAGIWEFIWMPFINLIGGFVCWVIGSRFAYYVNISEGRAYNITAIFACAVYGVIIAGGVAIMLDFVLGIPFMVLIGPLVISEVVLLIASALIVLPLVDKLPTWREMI